VQGASNSMMQSESETMLKYQELLILSYFKSHYKRYEFNELLRIMGMTYVKLKKTIDELLDKQYLVCYEGHIVISKQGEKLLQKSRLDKFYLDARKQTKIQNRLDIDKPYIPIGFEI